MTNSDGGSSNEKLRIKSDGKIGIGIANPGGKLHINGIGSGDIVAELDSGSPTFTYRNGSGAWFHAGKHPSQDAFIIADGANTTTNERFRITSAGNVVIGHTSAGNKLQVGNTGHSGLSLIHISEPTRPY